MKVGDLVVVRHGRHSFVNHNDPPPYGKVALIIEKSVTFSGGFTYSIMIGSKIWKYVYASRLQLLAREPKQFGGNK
tara:strand:- start:5309 stop:5536 length:228 start_codon:yes stop_codon:yes gene_type:complete